jgi:hypothetical protein
MLGHDPTLLTQYIPTLGVEIQMIHYSNIMFNWWDTGGLYRGGGVAYYRNANLGLCVHRDHLEPHSTWVSEFSAQCPNVPIVHCVNHFSPSSDLGTMVGSDHIYHINALNYHGVPQLLNGLVELVGAQ